MRNPPTTPQLFHDAVSDFLSALDVSIERIAPFAGLRPQQLYRLGKDGKHHTLVPASIDNLITAPVLVGRPVAPEVKDAWEKHLKVCSLYTVLIAATHRRTKSKWPQTPKDYAVVWEAATDMVLYSKYTVYFVNDGSYQNRETRGFGVDAAAIYEHWANSRIETQDDIVLALAEIDQPSAKQKG